MSISSYLQIAGMFLIPLIAVLVPVFIGLRYGAYHSRKFTEINPTAVGSVVGASMGLLAFMLAFTFQLASTRYSARRGLIVDEAINTRTTWLRSGLIPEPYRSASRKLLVEYVDLRVELAKDISRLDQAMSGSRQILDSLWQYSEALSAQDRSSESYALYITAVNDMVDVYNRRIVMSLQYRIPVTVFWILFIVGFFSMIFLGYQFGISGSAKKNGFKISLFLGVIFAVVMFLILALDRPEKGFIRLSQKPIFTLQQYLHEKQLEVRSTSP